LAQPGRAAPMAEPTLLHALLRHALLREIAGAAAALRAAETHEDLASLLRDAELVDLVSGAAPTEHWLRQLDKPLQSTGGQALRDYLQDPSHLTRPQLQSLAGFRAALGHLKDLDSEALQLLMQGTLDLSTHRLDAWITSFATRRLADMHIDGPNGQ